MAMDDPHSSRHGSIERDVKPQPHRPHTSSSRGTRLVRASVLTDARSTDLQILVDEGTTVRPEAWMDTSQCGQRRGPTRSCDGLSEAADLERVYSAIPAIDILVSHHLRFYGDSASNLTQVASISGRLMRESSAEDRDLRTLHGGFGRYEHQGIMITTSA
jgi:hypothetical protein